MIYLNQVIFAGTLAETPEIRMTAGGTAIANFSVSTVRTYQGRDQQVRSEETTLRCEAWGPVAETIRNWLRGEPVFLTGRMRVETWEDRQTGKPRSKTLFVAESAQSQRPPASPASRPPAPAPSAASAASRPAPRSAARPAAAAAAPVPAQSDAELFGAEDSTDIPF